MRRRDDTPARIARRALLPLIGALAAMLAGAASAQQSNRPVSVSVASGGALGGLVLELSREGAGWSGIASLSLDCLTATNALVAVARGGIGGAAPRTIAELPPLECGRTAKHLTLAFAGEAPIAGSARADYFILAVLF